MQEDFLRDGWVDLVDANDTRPVQDLPPNVQSDLRMHALLALERAAVYSAHAHALRTGRDTTLAMQEAGAAVRARYPA